MIKRYEPEDIAMEDGYVTPKMSELNLGNWCKSEDVKKIEEQHNWAKHVIKILLHCYAHDNRVPAEIIEMSARLTKEKK